MINQVRKENPLVHCMTNVVVTNFTANGLLALGASPVMAYAKEEVEDMASIAGTLLLNIGTLSSEEIDNMILAGKAANSVGIPVILDPVGAGATAFRTNMCQRILKEVNVSILRGNAGEITSLMGEKAEVKGVDGALDRDMAELAERAAKQFQCVTVVTGPVDVITDGKVTTKVHNGHPWLTKVVGTGCLLGAVIGAFIAPNRNELVQAATEAVAFYGICAELAYEKTANVGIGDFQQAFLNQLQHVTDEQVQQLRKIEA